MKYVFDSYRLDSSTRELRDGDALVAVEPKAFDLLLHLVENKDRVVSKDELIDAVWQARIVSDTAVSTAISTVRKSLGDDGSGQRYIKTIHGRGFRFVAPVVETAEPAPVDTASRISVEQQIRFCKSTDGTRIAYASSGQGPPLLKAANWLNHLEFDWESPVWSHFFAELTRRNQLIRYDMRGNGLSDWNVKDFGIERQYEDLCSVVDAAGLTTFPLFGVSQGCATSVLYASRHPERVTKLVLLGGYARGWRKRSDPQHRAAREAAVDLIRAGWGAPNPAVRQMFTAMYMPDAPAESQRWFSDLQRITASAENAAQILDITGNHDIQEVLPTVEVETLVIHARGDAGVPYEEGQILAAGIPNARFATLESDNHILPPTDTAWPRCARLIQDFLRDE